MRQSRVCVLSLFVVVVVVVVVVFILKGFSGAKVGLVGAVQNIAEPNSRSEEQQQQQQQQPFKTILQNYCNTMIRRMRERGEQIKGD